MTGSGPSNCCAGKPPDESIPSLNTQAEWIECVLPNQGFAAAARYRQLDRRQFVLSACCPLFGAFCARGNI